MAAPLELIERLTLKAGRAEAHIVCLESAWNSFFKNRPYEISIKDNPQAGERTYYLASVKDIPHEIPLIVGDAIQNLRSALDHLAHHLVAVGTGSPGPFPRVYFPIAESASKYKSEAPGKTKGMRNNAVHAISAIEPHKGGKGEILWHLHCLNNIDKHRLLLTVWADLKGHSILPSQRAKLMSIYRGSHPAAKDVPVIKGAFIAPTAKMFPLKAGDILLPSPTPKWRRRWSSFWAWRLGSRILSRVSRSSKRSMKWRASFVR